MSISRMQYQTLLMRSSTDRLLLLAFASLQTPPSLLALPADSARLPASFCLLMQNATQLGGWSK